MPLVLSQIPWSMFTSPNAPFLISQNSPTVVLLLTFPLPGTTPCPSTSSVLSVPLSAWVSPSDPPSWTPSPPFFLLLLKFLSQPSSGIWRVSPISTCSSPLPMKRAKVPPWAFHSPKHPAFPHTTPSLTVASLHGRTHRSSPHASEGWISGCKRQERSQDSPTTFLLWERSSMATLQRWAGVCFGKQGDSAAKIQIRAGKLQKESKIIELIIFHY